MAALVGVLALVSLAGAAALDHELAPIGTVSLWSVFLVGSALLVLPLAARHGAWARARFPLALLAFTPVVAVGALLEVRDPIVAAHWTCGTNDAALACFAPIVLLLVGPVATIVALRASRPGSTRRFRGGALGVTLALAGLVGVGVLGLGRPAPEAWVSSLPAVAVLTPTAGDGVTLDAIPSIEARVARRCRTSYCDVVLLDSAADLEDARAFFDRWDAHLESSYGGSAPAPHPFGVPGEQEISVRVDRAGELLLLAPNEGGAIAFDLRTKEPAEVTLRDVLGEVGPPHGMVLVAALGLLACVALILFARRRARELARIDEGREGVVTVDGVLSFDDGLFPKRARTTAPLAPGPALALTRGSELASYRGGGDEVVHALAGSREANRERASARVALRYAFAIAIAVLAATPLALMTLIDVL